MIDQSRSAGRHRAAPSSTHDVPSTLDEFNRADDTAASDLLGACLDIPAWVERVSSGRPYPDLTSLHAAGAAASEGVTWDQVVGALDRHPRIGEKKAAVAGTSTESAWSADEQAGLQSAGASTSSTGRTSADDPAVAIAEGNRAYEERFGFLFLICAAGLSAEQILADLNRRLTHDAEAEKPVVTGELKKIAALRLAKAVVT
ncbi:2-oxo-4-hydroxy-4-carboxy-5-ureidoimidazoline decarboxylase [Nakamurella sp. UYEF19]|uniref:2-oxo-4-hydroxy-4-carboxy-5-ureidoimidazoline decarboxylase n=1 Tax=Nakamurella sp. UYEF19 TaxID=1756392 RepID=UPI003394362F